MELEKMIENKVQCLAESFDLCSQNLEDSKLKLNSNCTELKYLQGGLTS